jgi:hypothetical protein
MVILLILIKDGGITSIRLKQAEEFFGSSLPTYYYGMNLQV